MRVSPVLTAYRAMTRVLGPLAGLYLLDRARRGKEDPARLGERFGRYTQKRPDGALVWMHAASVGESTVALALIEAMAARNSELSFLLTTGTRTSAELVARRAPVRTTHVYSPLDRPDCVRKFFDHWRPDLGVFLESELWPNLILGAQARGTKLALVNARMSPSSLERWKRWDEAGRKLIRAFGYVSAADNRTAVALTRMRRESVPTLGNLKQEISAPKVDAPARERLAAQIGQRPLWLAASTHAGEDEIALEAHALLREEHPDALLIIAPRHPDRGEDIARLCWNAPRRSLKQPIGSAAVYIADTLGELGTLYDLAPVALVGGSLLPHLKGHNPIEPTQLGSAIISGPYVESFADVFDPLFAADGAARVRNAQGLAIAVADFWHDEGMRQKQVKAARRVVAGDGFAQTVAQLLAMAPAQKPADAAA